MVAVLPARWRLRRLYPGRAVVPDAAGDLALPPRQAQRSGRTDPVRLRRRRAACGILWLTVSIVAPGGAGPPSDTKRARSGWSVRQPMSWPGRIQPSRSGTRGRRRRASVSRCLIGLRPREAAQSRRSAFWALPRRLARASIQIWTFGTRRCLIGDYQGRARAAPPRARPPHARWLLRL